MSGKHRMGRPLKQHPAGTQVTITLQVPAELKNRLQARALKSNRSLSQEAERRLVRSFSLQALYEDAAVLALEEATKQVEEKLAKAIAAANKSLEDKARLMDARAAKLAQAMKSVTE